jgi:hypothetical protein
MAGQPGLSEGEEQTRTGVSAGLFWALGLVGFAGGGTGAGESSSVQSILRSLLEREKWRKGITAHSSGGASLKGVDKYDT